ncbi:hypothetical protein SMC7_00745 [Candidatus Cryosericum terrychapinii]|uniref:Uncharacterized protein n=1 Tax=Candidatus Cryosericum terrychapinii TaxID=2290919 RepID=A0A398D206_9BACT|nr:hypothetical protein SMC7_00745 [Candidatus Cryosericum terrychapinii]
MYSQEQLLRDYGFEVAMHGLPESREGSCIRPARQQLPEAVDAQRVPLPGPETLPCHLSPSLRDREPCIDQFERLAYEPNDLGSIENEARKVPRTTFDIS